ncbi:glycine cleavage system protein GcvH [Thiococcus pfennigii]|uniref:glycine cleavage system protein GcvH n=1 Tax=Thiococcus pfennigii TaxID=1057 RepID=UPI0019062AAD|nr:glycine cleavage system protein GcvH [Thiococcus pfennigii]MBK1701954.1 glycine cleavage system protein H [Thiococcus pfennigii]MBK1733128.1 glycine cleavage system protein H [Thiococcus pfennigii]
MSNLPEELRYTKSHEWVKDNGDGTLTVGITDHAQDALGDLVYVELPEVGRQVGAGEACAVVESVKAASDIYSPLAGEVIEANPGLAEAPETVNQAPYGEGWLFKLRADAAALGALLDADGYAKTLEEDA